MKLSLRIRCVCLGMLIGSAFSSTMLVLLRFLAGSRVGTMGIFYLYVLVGGLTGYFVYNSCQENIEPVPIDDQIPEFPIKNQTLDQIKDLKRTSVILKSLMETKKRLEEIKNESNSIVNDIGEKMDEKSSDLVLSYLKTS